MDICEEEEEEEEVRGEPKEKKGPGARRRLKAQRMD